MLPVRRKNKSSLAQSDTATDRFDHMEETTNTTMANALLPWDNRARLSLPKGLVVWLAFLVVTFLCSLLFIRDHNAARWAIGGFIASHLVVIYLSNKKGYILRRGMVSLTHVVGRSPALIVILLTLSSGQVSGSYRGWLIVQGIVITGSLVFDLRDSISFLRHRGRTTLE
jgi:hypothetical protein